MTTQYSRTLDHFAKPFVDSGMYKSTDEFVSDLLKDVASRKIKEYERKIKRYQAKYGSFEGFSQKIRNKATPNQEDMWMQWEADANMLQAWKRVNSELDSSASQRHS